MGGRAYTSSYGYNLSPEDEDIMERELLMSTMDQAPVDPAMPSAPAALGARGAPVAQSGPGIPPASDADLEVLMQSSLGAESAPLPELEQADDALAAFDLRSLMPEDEEPAASASATSSAVSTSTPPSAVPRTKIDYQKQTERLTTPDEGVGESRNILGYENELVDTPDKRVAKLNELLAKRGPQSSSDGPGKFEREFLANHQRPSDRDKKRAWVLMTLFGGEGENYKMVEMLNGQQAQFDAGLTAARNADEERRQRNAPVDPATMDLAVRAGVQAENALSMTRGSEAMGLIKSMPYVYQNEKKRQSQERHDTQAGLVDLTKAEITQNGATDRTLLSNASRENIADKKIAAKKSKPGATSAAPVMASDDQLRPLLIAAANGDAALVDEAMALANSSGGVPDTGDPAKDIKLHEYMSLYLIGKQSGVDELNKYRKDVWGKAGSRTNQEHSAAVRVEAGKHNVRDRSKIRVEMDEAKRVIRSAFKAWEALTPEERTLVAKTGGNLQNLLIPGKQAEVATLQGVFNSNLKMQAGTAQSKSEFQRVAAESGFTDTVSLFQSPDRISNFLNTMLEKYRVRKQAYASQYGNELFNE